jgi:hypothetical protein
MYRSQSKKTIPGLITAPSTRKLRESVSADSGQEIQVEVPPDVEVGVYANFALVSGGEHDFTIDFCQLDPPRDESAPARVRVVTRVRIAPTFIGPLLQAISQNAFNRDELLRKAQEEQEGGEPG